jgi:hypothetical protein
MDETEPYLQLAADFERMAEAAPTEHLREAYREVARGYRTLAAHAGFPQTTLLSKPPQ